MKIDVEGRSPLRARLHPNLAAVGLDEELYAVESDA